MSRSLAATPFGSYGGQQTRGVFQAISRLVISGTPGDGAAGTWLSTDGGQVWTP